MGQDTAIEWATHTFNAWRGCTRDSDGCKFCYAEKWAERNPKTLGLWGPKGSRPIASEAMWKLPLKWQRDAAEEPFVCKGCGQRYLSESGSSPRCNWRCEIVPYRPRVFSASLSDWLEGPETMPEDARNPVFAARLRLLRLIHATPNLDWLLLTKRPQNFVTLMGIALNEAWGVPQVESEFAVWLEHWFTGRRVPTNVWIGTTVENNREARRIEELKKIPAAVRFLSCEPLLEDLDLRRHLWSYDENASRDMGAAIDTPDGSIDWIICGGESGPNARPMNPQWARSLRDQAVAAHVPFLFKQHGEYAPISRDTPMPLEEANKLMLLRPDGTKLDVVSEDCTAVWKAGKKRAGRLLDGRTWDEFPLVARS